jgi:hypothetical protein
LDFDAHRTFVGMQPGALVAIILSCVFGTLGAAGLVTYLLVTR